MCSFSSKKHNFRQTFPYWHAVICHLSQSIALRQGNWVNMCNCDSSSKLSHFQLKDSSAFFPSGSKMKCYCMTSLVGIYSVGRWLYNLKIFFYKMHWFYSQKNSSSSCFSFEWVFSCRTLIFLKKMQIFHIT